MENIEQANENSAQKPKNSQTAKSMDKIINKRYINKKIFTLFCQRNYYNCLELIQCYPSDQFKLFISALIHRNLFHFETSTELFTECHTLNRLNSNYLKNIAKNQYFILNDSYLMGKYKSSLEVAKDAFKINSEDSQIFFIIGKVSVAINDFENAEKQFNESISKMPNQQAGIEKAEILKQNGRYKQAARQLQQSLNFSGQNPKIYELLAENYAKMGIQQFAEKYYKLAMKQNPRNFQAMFQLGSIKQINQQLEESLQFYKRAHEINPNSAELWNKIAIHMINKNKFIGAYACLKKALYFDPLRWDVYYKLWYFVNIYYQLQLQNI